jgi:hypothetical protein
MDVIQDAELAISALLARDAVTDLGENYLALYGVLQAVTLQQNALIRLWTAALRQKWQVTDQMKLVRDLRDRIVGHPAPAPSQKSGMQYASFISRFSLESGHVEILKVGSDNTKNWESVKLASLVRGHLDEMARELHALAGALDAAEKERKEQIMRRGPLSDLLHPACEYLVGKLWEAALATPATASDRIELARAAVSSLEKMASAVSDGLRARGLAPIDAWHREVLERALSRIGELLRPVPAFDDVALDLIAYTTLIDREFQHIRDVLSDHDKALEASE